MDHASLDELRTRAQDLHSFADQCLQLLERQSTEFQVQAGHTDQLRVKVELLQSLVDQLSQERDGLRSELNSITQECEDLQSRSQALPSTGAITTLEEELASCRHELADLCHENQLLRLQLEQSRAEHRRDLQNLAVTSNRASLQSAT